MKLKGYIIDFNLNIIKKVYKMIIVSQMVLIYQVFYYYSIWIIENNNKYNQKNNS